MKQSNGAELFGNDDPRSSMIGIIHVAATDDREGVVAAILTQDKLGRKQIVVVLPAENKAFQHSVDFDGLKNMKRKLQGQLIIIAPAGSNPAEFARKRRFQVFTSPESYKIAAPDQPPSKRRFPFPSLPANSQEQVPGEADLASKQQIDTLTDTSEQGEEPLMPPPAEEPLSTGEQEHSVASSDASQQSEEQASLVSPRSEMEDHSSEKFIYLSPDDDLNQIKERLTHVTARRIMLVVPSQTQLRSHTAWKVIHSWARELGKDITVISGDRALRSTAKGAGLRINDPSEPTLPSTNRRRDSSGRFGPRRLHPRITRPLTPDQQETPQPEEFTLEPPFGVPFVPVDDKPPAPDIEDLGDEDDLLPPEPPIIPFPPLSRTSSAEGATGGSTTGRRPVSPRLIDKPPVGTPPPQRRRPRWLLPVLLFLVILIIIGGGFLLWLSAVQAGQASSATVIITPASDALHNTYIITAVTGLPNPAQRQVRAHIYSYTTSSQTVIVKATGQGLVTAVAATGSLTFYNALPYPQSIAPGTVLTDTNGIQIVTEKAAVIPAASPPAEGSITIPAHAIVPGASGNIPALDFNTVPCCISGISVINENAFSGGQDQQHYTYVQQADIDAAANSMKNALAQNGMAGLKTLLPSNEPLIGPMRCVPAITSDHVAGDKAASVTVSAADTCTGETYDQQAALSMAGNLLQSEAASRLGTGYILRGTLVTTITKAVAAAATNTISLAVEAKGTWTFRFTPAQQNALARLIAGKSEQAALNLLRQQAGIARASIQFPWPGAATLPGNARSITIKLQG